MKLGRPKAGPPSSPPMDWAQFIDEIVGNKRRQLFQQFSRASGSQGEIHRQKAYHKKTPASAVIETTQISCLITCATVGCVEFSNTLF